MAYGIVNVGSGGSQDTASEEFKTAVRDVISDCIFEHNEDEAAHGGVGQLLEGLKAPVLATLLADNWTGEGPCTQEVAVAGMGAASAAYVSLASGATPEQRAAARAAMLFPTGQGEGIITITADGEVPAIDLPIAVAVLGG